MSRTGSSFGDELEPSSIFILYNYIVITLIKYMVDNYKDLRILSYKKKYKILGSSNKFLQVK